MTQQNAALVEQSAAAADMLKDQAARLDAVVQHFALADDTPLSDAFGLDAAAAAGVRSAVDHGDAIGARSQSDWNLLARAS